MKKPSSFYEQNGYHSDHCAFAKTYTLHTNKMLKTFVISIVKKYLDKQKVKMQSETFWIVSDHCASEMFWIISDHCASEEFSSSWKEGHLFKKDLDVYLWDDWHSCQKVL